MGVDYARTASALLGAIGGESNIVSLTHCVTRLRFVLKDESCIDDNEVKSINGVIGTMKKGGQYQVIIGNDVAVCYEKLLQLGEFSTGTNVQKQETEKRKFTMKAWGNSILDAIAGSMAPIIQAIVGCGMIKLVVTILQLMGVPSDLPTVQLLSAIGDAGFYFLPIILAASAADKFGCNRPLAMVLTAVLVHPDLITILAAGNVTFLQLPVTAATYSSSVIPALLITWALSKVEPVLDRYMHGWVRTIFKPLLILLIGAPLALIVLAPIGAWLGNGLAFILSWAQAKCGWLMLGILSALTPLIVMSGMHYALVPNCVSTLGLYGYETILGPIMLASNFAQASACAAVTLKTKNKDLKAISFTSFISALVVGTTEPALYGVTMKLKKPLAASMIGAGCAGLFAGITGLQNYALVTPSLVAIVQFISVDLKMNFLYALITAGIAVIVTFILTLVMGWDDPLQEHVETGTENIHDGNSAFVTVSFPATIEAPVKGEIVSLSEVNDETFASGILGKGFAVKPTEGKVYAPFDGECYTIFETLHAIGLVSDYGASLLIHVGLETVGLAGKPFKAYVKSGDKVKKGQLLLEFDINQIQESGCDTITPVLVVNEQELGKVTVENDRIIIEEANDEIS
ncbi:MAG: beta-glucoside-specific PTS transporter subunit IIABC [Clostridium sp.]|nr:beta-glucoside-specific PTS transporter subunit IIABC [Clostridium sp.]